MKTRCFTGSHGIPGPARRGVGPGLRRSDRRPGGGVRLLRQPGHQGVARGAGARCRGPGAAKGETHGY